MTQPSSRLLLAVTGALLAGVCIIAALYWDVRVARSREGLVAFRAFLERHYPGKKWQVGPDRLDCPAVRAAYPGQRFYYVYSSPPPGPGAVDPRLHERHRQALESFRRTHLSLTARVDEGLQVFPLERAGDYNPGLMEVHGADDARIAAAAILSLHASGLVGPGPVSPQEVSVEKGASGWSCRVNRKGELEGRVAFDAGGRCTAVWKAYTGGLPP